jgi:hypothetical protein
MDISLEATGFIFMINFQGMRMKDSNLQHGLQKRC